MKKRVFFAGWSFGFRFGILFGFLIGFLILSGTGLVNAQPDSVEQGNSYAQVVLLNGTINGSGLAIATGERWTLYQGYSLYVLGIDVVQSRVMIRLLHDTDVVFESWIQAGDSFTYTKQIHVGGERDVKYNSDGSSGNNTNNSSSSSSNRTIFSASVDSLYEGGTRDLVMLYPIYQYLDTDYETPVIKVLPAPQEIKPNKTPLNDNNNNNNNNSSKNNKKSKESPSSGISLVIPIMLIVVLYIQIKNRKLT